VDRGHYGALNNIPTSCSRRRSSTEQVLADGVTRQIATHKEVVVYMLILAFATGTQLFVEPQLVSERALARSAVWSPNELAYVLACQKTTSMRRPPSPWTCSSSAYSVRVLVFRTKLFEWSDMRIVKRMWCARRFYPPACVHSFFVVPSSGWSWRRPKRTTSSSSTTVRDRHAQQPLACLALMFDFQDTPY